MYSIVAIKETIYETYISYYIVKVPHFMVRKLLLRYWATLSQVSIFIRNFWGTLKSLSCANVVRYLALSYRRNLLQVDPGTSPATLALLSPWPNIGLAVAQPSSITAPESLPSSPLELGVVAIIGTTKPCGSCCFCFRARRQARTWNQRSSSPVWLHLKVLISGQFSHGWFKRSWICYGK